MDRVLGFWVFLVFLFCFVGASSSLRGYFKGDCRTQGSISKGMAKGKGQKWLPSLSLVAP